MVCGVHAIPDVHAVRASTKSCEPKLKPVNETSKPVKSILRYIRSVKLSHASNVVALIQTTTGPNAFQPLHCVSVCFPCERSGAVVGIRGGEFARATRMRLHNIICTVHMYTYSSIYIYYDEVFFVCVCVQHSVSVECGTSNADDGGVGVGGH